MEYVTTIILSGDPCSLLFLVLLALVAGGVAVRDHPQLKLWGKRCAGIGFIVAVLYRANNSDPTFAEDWIAILLSAAIVAGLILGAAWVALALLELLFRFTLKTPLNAVWNIRDRARRRRDEAEHDRRREDERRERAREEDAARQRQAEQAEKETKARRRRSAARAKALRNFSLYAQKVGGRFSKAMFERYVKDFMGENHAPADVERRGKELVDILEKHAQEANPPRKEATIEDVTHWYLDQQQRIDALPLEDRVKRRYLAALRARYSALTNEILERMQP